MIDNKAVMQMALDALVIAEAGLADIGDADREPGDDVAWCEARAAQALRLPRNAIVALRVAIARLEQPASTVWPPGMLQDESRELSRWLSNKPNAKQEAREAIAQPEQTAIKYTYASTQETNCAGCGQLKHTPLRVGGMGGYVCLTCIDKELTSLIDSFIEAEPVAWRKANSDGFYRYYEADEDQPAGCEPLYSHNIAQPKDKP